MSVRQAELAQAAAKMALRPQGGVPILDAVPGQTAENSPTQSLGFWPLVAVIIALAATLGWNGFLLWEGAMLVLGWLGLT